MDKFGRTKFTIGGLIVVGTMFILMTKFSEVYPTLAIIYCTFCAAYIVPMIAPFVIDYVK